jgi:hypothetical protein
VIVATSRIASLAIAVAVVAWLFLLIGLVYARFVVPESLPNPVIVFSSKGLTGLLVELVSFAIGRLGLLLVLIAFITVARTRALAVAAVANASLCVVCAVLLA